MHTMRHGKLQGRTMLIQSFRHTPKTLIFIAVLEMESLIRGKSNHTFQGFSAHYHSLSRTQPTPPRMPMKTRINLDTEIAAKTPIAQQFITFQVSGSEPG